MLALTSCVRFHPQPINPAKNIADFESRTLDHPDLKKFLEQNLTRDISWPPPSWDFNQLTLAAFYYHPDLDVARAKWAVAKGGKITAGERPNPTVSFSPAYNATTPPPWILGGSFDIPIETAGKRGYRIAQAKNLSEAARFNIATVAWSVRHHVRKSLVALYAATERESLLKKQDAIQSEIVGLLEGQLSAGGVSRFEVTQSRLALNNVRLSLHDAQIQLAQSKIDLASAVGLAASAFHQVKISFAGLDQVPAKISYQEIRHNALLSRADLLSALADYAAAESAFHLEIARQYPDIHLSPGYTLDQTDDKWGLGLSATLPVFNHNRGAIAEADARRQEVAARFNALQSSVLGEIDRAFAGYRSVLEKNSAAQTLLDDQTQQAQSSKALWEAGEISRQDLAFSQIELTTAKLSRLNVRVQTQEALGVLEEAVQRPIAQTGPVFAIPSDRPTEEKKK